MLPWHGSIDGPRMAAVIGEFDEIVRDVPLFCSSVMRDVDGHPGSSPTCADGVVGRAGDEREASYDLHT